MRVRPTIARCAAVTLVLVLSCFATGCGGGEPTAEDLAGTDSSGNGVRDDVEAFIDDFDDELHAYLLAVAANEQQVVTFDPDAADATRRATQIAEEANRLVTCPPDGVDRSEARDAAAAVRERTADTAQRRHRTEGFTATIDGMSFLAPDCDVDPSVSDESVVPSQADDPSARPASGSDSSSRG